MNRKYIFGIATAAFCALGVSYYVVDARHDAAVRNALPDLAAASNQLANAATLRAGKSGEQSYLVDYVLNAADGFRNAAKELTIDPNGSSARSSFAAAKATFEQASHSLYCASAVFEQSTNAEMLQQIAKMDLETGDNSRAHGSPAEAALFYSSAQTMAGKAADYYDFMFMSCRTSSTNGALNSYNEKKARAVYAQAKQSLDQLAETKPKEAIAAAGDAQNTFAFMHGRIEVSAAIDLAQRAKAIERAGDNTAASIVYAIAAKWQKDGSRYLAAYPTEQDDASRLADLYGSWAGFTKDHSEMPLLDRTWQSFQEVERNSTVF